MLNCGCYFIKVIFVINKLLGLFLGAHGILCKYCLEIECTCNTYWNSKLKNKYITTRKQCKPVLHKSFIKRNSQIYFNKTNKNIFT